MPIREFFHLIHIVDDIDAAQERYADLLAPEVYRSKSWSDFDKRWASLGVIGPDFVLEIMQPSAEEADQQSPLPKFRARHGQHLHSMAWYVDADHMGPLMERMRRQGVRVITPYPVDPGRPEAAPATFFTHPKDTFGQLEFQRFPVEGSQDRHIEPDWTGAYWRAEHPLGIERLSHVTTVVADLDRAVSLYRDVMDAPPFLVESTGDRRSAFVFVGTEAVVELAQPSSPDGRPGRDLARHGELPHAVTFKVSDLSAVEKHLSAIGLRIADQSDESIVVDPADLFNGVVGFTTRVLPGDPRT